MSKVKATLTQRAIFGERFSRQYEAGVEAGKWSTQTECAELLNTTRGSVAKWMSGDNIPQKETIKKICEVFGIDGSDLDYTNPTHDELYRLDSPFMTKLGNEHYKFAQEIGLNMTLVKALESLVDFDSLFPLYSPIQNSVWDPETRQRIYNREVEHSHSAKIDQDLQYLQLNRDGKRITMHRCDLAFLKEVQDAVVDAVEFLFYKRTKEMKREVEAFNRDRIIVTKNGEVVDPSEVPDGDPVVFDSPEAFDKALEKLRESLKEDGSEYKVTRRNDITRDYILEHDRFAKYMRVVDPKRKATQKDIDAFFGKGENNGNDQSKNK